VILADFCLVVHIPFLLLAEALFSVFLKSLHIGYHAGDPEVVAVA
jgi:hypothetical protein